LQFLRTGGAAIEGRRAARRLNLRLLPSAPLGRRIMSRHSRHRNAGHVFHVMNRATRGQLLFADVGEYLLYQALLAQALIERPIRLLAYTLMPNHFHMAVWPERDGQISRFLQWLLATHARRLHRKRGTAGTGAIYQSRFKAVPVETETYFYRMMRYVDRNPPRAGLATRPEKWPFGSASSQGRGFGIELAEWPLPKPPNWREYINSTEPYADLEFIRTQTQCGEPIGHVPLIVLP
jgi:putative transposase